MPGRNSGTSHTVPVAYFDHNGGYLVVGTGMGGSTAIPQWFRNLQATGLAHVQLGSRSYDVDARIISAAERETLWPHIAARAAHFAKWQQRTGRVFPIAVLTAHSSPG
jgi:deazaflavin-dependent oxidoreductase (nitroreductase family)